MREAELWGGEKCWEGECGRGAGSNRAAHPYNTPRVVSAKIMPIPRIGPEERGQKKKDSERRKDH